MDDPSMNRRLLLKLGGAGVAGGLMSSSAVAQDGEVGQINSLSGFETPQPITDNSNRFLLISPANRLNIDAQTDDMIDLVFEWDDSITNTTGGSSISGSGILLDESDVGEQRAIYRGPGFDNIVYDRLTLRGLDTSRVSPGDEVTVEVSARQADSPEDTDDFETVVAAVDDGTFEPEVTTEATVEVTQGTIISANETATTRLELEPEADHTIAFDIDQLRDDAAGGTPAGPAKGIIIDYNIDDEDGLDFDLSNDDVTLGGAAASLDVEVVKSLEIPGIGQVLLKIANNETLEDGANLTTGDTVTVELSGLNTAGIDPSEIDLNPSVNVGLHGPATFDPIVENLITPDRGAYAIDRAGFRLGERPEIEDWNDLNAVRNDLDGEYTLVADLDETTDGYDEHVGDPEKGWDPLGDIEDSEDPFTGIFDGNGHDITGLQIDRSDEAYVGLFSSIADGIVTDVTLVDATVTGDDFVGTLVGFNNGRIQQSTASGSVTSNGIAGGLTGYNIGNVLNSHYDITDLEINGEQQLTAGGLFADQYQDWIESGMQLTLDEYESLSVVDDVIEISGVQGVRDALGFIDNTGHEWRLTTDIDLTTEDVDLYFPYFAGELTGNDHTLTVDIDLPAVAPVGAIGYNAGTITGVSTVGSVVGGGSVGGLVGYNRLEIREATTSADVTGERVVGGLVGESFSAMDVGIRESTASGNVTGETFVGGLAGANNTTIRNSTASGNVTGTDDERTRVGGFAGWNTGIIENAQAEGSVEGVYNVGGFVGLNLGDGDIKDSYATGDVVAVGDGSADEDRTGESRAGGFAGNNQGAVRRSYGTGTVDVTGQRSGGLAGRNSGVIEDGYATGRVTGQDRVGGLVGQNATDSPIQRCYAVGEVDGSDAVGGLVGSADGTGVGASYWDVESTGSESGIGETDPAVLTSSGDADDDDDLNKQVSVLLKDSHHAAAAAEPVGTAEYAELDDTITGLLTDEMQGQAATENMPALDFSETWQIVTDPDDYPMLQPEDDEGADDAPVVVGDNPATDTTGDGLLNDVDGDGEFDVFDVQAFFNNLESDPIQNNPERFDFSESGGDPDIFDVQALFAQLQDQ